MKISENQVNKNWKHLKILKINCKSVKILKKSMKKVQKLCIWRLPSWSWTWSRKKWILGGFWLPSWSPKIIKLAPRALLGRLNKFLCNFFNVKKKVCFASWCCYTSIVRHYTCKYNTNTAISSKIYRWCCLVKIFLDFLD